MAYDSYLYAVKVLPTGPIKIGRTTDPAMRFGQLQTGNHMELKLLFICLPTALSGPEAEEIVHLRFDDRRVRGEWFSVSEAEVRDAFVDVGTVMAKQLRGSMWRHRQASSEKMLAALKCHPRHKLKS